MFLVVNPLGFFFFYDMLVGIVHEHVIKENSLKIRLLIVGNPISKKDNGDVEKNYQLIFNS